MYADPTGRGVVWDWLKKNIFEPVKKAVTTAVEAVVNFFQEPPAWAEWVFGIPIVVAGIFVVAPFALFSGFNSVPGATDSLFNLIGGIGGAIVGLLDGNGFMAGGGICGWLGNIFNTILGWLGIGSDKPGNGFSFLSDAEYGVSFSGNGSGNSSSMMMPGGGSMAPAGTGILKPVEQVNLIYDPTGAESFDSGTIAVDQNTILVPYDNISWTRVDTITGKADFSDNLKLPISTPRLSNTAEGKKECSNIVWARGMKGGKTISGCEGSVPVVVTKLLVENPSSPHNTGPFNGVPTATNGYAYERPGENAGRIKLTDLAFKSSTDPSYNYKTNYRTCVLGEIKYSGTDYYVLTTTVPDKQVMYVKQSEMTRVVWPINEDVSSPFGFRVLNRPKNPDQAKSHQGVDTGANSTSPVYAIMDGTVVRVRPNTSSTGRGTFIVIEHKIAGGYTYYTTYQHLNYDSPNKILVKVNDKVAAGKQIATAGDTGAGGLHHHFQVHRGHPGTLDDPTLDDPRENVINPIDRYDSSDTRKGKGHSNPNAMFADYDGWFFNPIFDWAYGNGAASKTNVVKVREAYFTGLDLAPYHNYSEGNTHITKAAAIRDNIFSNANTTTRTNGGWYDYNP